MIIARVLSIPHVVDGDTVWVQLEFTVGSTLDGRELIERDYLGGSKMRLTREELTLNTPEKKDDPEGWAKARTELSEWCEAALAFGPVTAEIIGKELGTKKDSFGRYLGDLRVGLSASAVRYMRSQGWDGYKG